MDTTAPTTPSPTRTRLALLVREIAASGMAALAAAVVAGGLGGRLAMRLSAIINPAMTGRLSDNGNRIGSVTTDGTIGLILFGGLFAGIAVAWVWVAVRPWLPADQPRRRLAATIAAVALVGFLVVEAQNFDFFILDPGWLHVLVFAGIVGGAGALTEWFDRHLVDRFTAASDFTVGASIILLLGLPIAIPAMTFFFSTETCECDRRPWLVGTALLVVLAATVGTWVWRVRGSSVPRWLYRFGQTATGVAILLGLAYLTGEVAPIL